MRYLIPFHNQIEDFKLPEYFTNPFDYTPHALCKLAAEQLQAQLGIPKPDNKGKMYSVLVVENKKGQLGFLAAYSGNEKAQTTEIPFVPQVFELTNPEGFFCKGEIQLNQINQRISDLENSPQRKELLKILEENNTNARDAIQAAKLSITKAKKSGKPNEKRH